MADAAAATDADAAADRTPSRKPTPAAGARPTAGIGETGESPCAGFVVVGGDDGGVELLFAPLKGNLRGPMDDRDSRRGFLTLAGAGALLAACSKEQRPEPAPPAASAVAAPSTTTSAGPPAKESTDPEVTATEDLMREHGVIRRAIVVYREAAMRLRAKPANVPLDALQKAAKLLRSFAEDYHEKLLEEAHIFPAVKNVGGAMATRVDTLIAQHNRGREITEYVIAVTAAPIRAKADELARTLDGFARMYEEHAAIEDTIVFPAWKKTMNEKKLDEMGDLFEDIEHKTFGKDGFDDAVDQITAIEKIMGIDLAGMTPLPPPKA
jgi:hemerythrin-like domain-containing protein